MGERMRANGRRWKWIIVPVIAGSFVLTACSPVHTTSAPVACSYPKAGAGCAADADGDFIADVFDAFPNDPAESLDRDGDGIGDNSDPYRVVLFVAQQGTYASLGPQIDRFMQDVARDAQVISKLLIIPANETPRQLKTRFEMEADLWGAFFIGDVPLVFANNGSRAQLSDHYYRAFQCPYQETSDPKIMRVMPDASVIVACEPNIWVSRIQGTLPAAEGLAQIKAYLNKNHATRQNHERWDRRMWFGAAMPREDQTDYAEELAAVFADHPLYAASAVEVMQDDDAIAQKTAFVRALSEAQELVKLNVHGMSSAVEFQGLDVTSVETMRASEIRGIPVRAKIVEMDSCSVGNHSIPPNFAAELLHAGDTLLVAANPAVVLVASGATVREMSSSYKAYGLGFSHADLYTFFSLGHARHFVGDPTVALRDVAIPQNRPRLFLNDTHFDGTGEFLVDFDRGSVDATARRDVVVTNTGTATLVIEGRWIADFWDTDGASIPSTHGFVFSIDRFAGVPAFQLQIAPGQFETLSFLFNPGANTQVMPRGTAYNGMFYFYTNDPHVGAFKVKTKGSVH